MKYNDFKLIEGMLLNSFQSVLKHHEIIDYKQDYTFEVLEDKENILFYVAELDLDIDKLYSLNLLALNKYISVCESYQPKSNFMRMELENGLDVAMRLKKDFCSTVFA
ncbi:hypothetical protein ACPUEX_22535 [Enterobacter vonholyi]